MTLLQAATLLGASALGQSGAPQTPAASKPANATTSPMPAAKQGTVVSITNTIPTPTETPAEKKAREEREFKEKVSSARGKVESQIGNALPAAPNFDKPEDFDKFTAALKSIPDAAMKKRENNANADKLAQLSGKPDAFDKLTFVNTGHKDFDKAAKIYFTNAIKVLDSAKGADGKPYSADVKKAVITSFVDSITDSSKAQKDSFEDTAAFNRPAVNSKLGAVNTALTNTQNALTAANNELGATQKTLGETQNTLTETRKALGESVAAHKKTEAALIEANGKLKSETDAKGKVEGELKAANEKLKIETDAKTKAENDLKAANDKLKIETDAKTKAEGELKAANDKLKIETDAKTKAENDLKAAQAEIEKLRKLAEEPKPQQ